MDKEKLTWRSFVDRPAKKDAPFGTIADRWHLDGTPTLYVIDHRGVIRHHWLDTPGIQAMDEAIDKRIREAEKDANTLGK